MINGIDLYHGNTMPDLSTYDFVIHKCTEGLAFIDPACQSRLNTVRSLGKIAGMYHFLTTGSDPVLQAEYFLSNANVQPGDFLALDYENDGTWSGLTNAEIAELGHQFMDAIVVDAPGTRVLLYCNQAVQANIVVPFGVPIYDGLWIADYSSEPQLGQLMWQYDSNVYDHDQAYFPDVATMRAWTKKPLPTGGGNSQKFILTEE